MIYASHIAFQIILKVFLIVCHSPLIKEKAVKKIQRMPDDNMLYVINILQILEAMYKDKEKDRQKARTALENILSMERRRPEGFDPQKELDKNED